MRPPRFLRQAREAARRQAQERRNASSLPIGYSGVSDLTGVSVTPMTALSLAAAFACINVIATDTAALPLAGYRKRKSGGRDQVDDLAGAELMGFSPDGETTGMRWRQAWMGRALGWGNGIARIARSGDGQPASLHLLDAGTKARRRRSDGGLYYEGSGQETYRADDVLHLAGFGYDGLNGYTPPSLLRQAFALGLAAEGAGAAFYGHGLLARGGLKVPAGMPKEARERLRKNFESWHAGVENAYRMPLLEEGVEFQPFSIDPVDAQFLETRKFQVLEVCRIYRVPPHKVMDYSQAHLANLEESNLDYLTTTLMPWCEAMEAVVNMKLLTAEQRSQGYYFEHIMAALLRGNMAARSAFYEVMERIGVMSPNDIAARENLNPIDGGDVHLIPLNYTTLDKVGMLIPSKDTPKKAAANGHRDAHHRNELPA